MQAEEREESEVWVKRECGLGDEGAQAKQRAVWHTESEVVWGCS